MATRYGEGVACDYDLLVAQATNDGPTSPLAKVIALRAKIFAAKRADGVTNAVVRYKAVMGGCIRVYMPGETLKRHHHDQKGELSSRLCPRACACTQR